MRHQWNAAITIAFVTCSLSVLIVGRAVAASSTTSPGTVQVRGGTLQYIAADGFRNKVDVTGGPSRFAATTDLVVTDATGLVAGAGCSQITSTRVDCGAGGVSSVLLDGGDRSDALGSETYLATTLYGGYGDDGLGGAGPATFGDGGPGNDILYGSGTSTLIGSSGNDLIEGAVHGVDLIYGGAGDDTLNGIGRNDVVKGGDGADTIDGRAGDDTLRGGAGDDSNRGWRRQRSDLRQHRCGHPLGEQQQRSHQHEHALPPRGRLTRLGRMRERCGLRDRGRS